MTFLSLLNPRICTVFGQSKKKNWREDQFISDSCSPQLYHLSKYPSTPSMSTIVPKKSSTRKPTVGVLKPSEPIVSKPRRPTVGKLVTTEQVATVKPIIGTIVWSKDECKQMDDTQRVEEFSRITGHYTLGCTHCGNRNAIPKHTSIAERWVNTIRAHTSKHGMYYGMPLPKTCDAQRARNAIQNPITNKYYDSYYTRLYKGPPMTSEELIEFEEKLRQQLLAVGVVKRD